MSLLLDPNIAYFLLIVGSIFIFLGLFAPGTGIIEILAVLALFVAGYGILNQPINTWALLLLLFGAAPLILAVRFSKNRTHSLIYLGLAMITLIAGSVFLFRGNGRITALNPYLAVGVSVVTAVLFYFIFQKGIEAMGRRPTHDPGRLIGQVGEARTNIFREGTVYVNGEDWTARSSQEISAGSTVKIVSRDGLILHVQKEN